MRQSPDFQKKVGKFQDKALQSPVTVLKHGEPHVVLVSAADYSRLKSLDRQALHPSQLAPELVDALIEAAAPPEAATFNHEAEGQD